MAKRKLVKKPVKKPTRKVIAAIAKRLSSWGETTETEPKDDGVRA